MEYSATSQFGQCLVLRLMRNSEVTQYESAVGHVESMRLYYSVVDPFPAYRADVAELFAVELPKLGLTTEWFMAQPNEQVGNADHFAAQVVHLPCDVKSQSGLIRKLAYWLGDARFLLGVSPQSIDAIQCRDKYWGAMVGLAVARMKGLPFFYWCSYPFPEHDAVCANQATGPRRAVGRMKAAIRFALLYKWICQRADHVFVQSERMKSDMHAYGIANSKMTPVPMGVSARVFDWVKANHVDVISGRVVYLGTLATVRKLDMLLDAFQVVKGAVPSAQLMFVGDGDLPYERQALMDKARAMGLDKDVMFTGFVPMDDAWRIAASAAVCVSPFYPTPILAPASPTKLVEYLALGRPVVCNHHPEQSQIIRDSGAGLCVEWSAPAFATAILQLLRDPKAAESMAAKGPAWIARHRTYPMIAKQVWEQYQSLLERNR